LDLRERKWQEAGEDFIMRSFITCTLHKVLSGDQTKVDALSQHLACMVEMRNAYRILVGKPVGKRPVGRPRLR